MYGPYLSLLGLAEGHDGGVPAVILAECEKNVGQADGIDSGLHDVRIIRITQKVG